MSDQEQKPEEDNSAAAEESVAAEGEATLSEEASAANAEELLESLLNEVERNLVEEYKDRAARAEAELANFRNRVERDRSANRDAVIIEVIRALLPAMDDLARAEAHGDLSGSPLEIVAQKIRTGFERFGLKSLGAIGDRFDPNQHEAIATVPKPDATPETIVDVLEIGYAIGERLIRPAKVAVAAASE